MGYTPGPISRDEKTPLRSFSPVPSQHLSPPTARASWRKPASMLCLFLIGIACAVGHHTFYGWRDGKQADGQNWTIRIGIALAHLSAFSLAAVGAISRDQWLWHNLRTQFLTLGAIDAMFGVTSSALCFFNRDMLRGAKISTAMAIVKWLFPLLPVFTPSTISVVQQYIVTSDTCIVPTLDFRYYNDRGMNRVSRDWSLGDALYLSYLGTSTYSEPSAMGFSLLTVPAFSGWVTGGNSTPFNGQALCGGGNVTCTYSIQFEGPAVNCTEPDYPIDDPRAPWYGVWDFSLCNHSFSNATLPMFGAAMNQTANTFWALSSVRGSTGSPTACREFHGYICQASVGNYSVDQIFVNGQFWEPDISVDILYPVMDSRENVSRPDHPHYPNYGNIPNWILFDVLADLLNGTQELTLYPGSVESSGSGYFQKPTHSALVVTDTRVDGTPLMNSSFNPVYPLGPAIEEMTHEMVVSLLSYPYSSYYSNMETDCYRGEYVSAYEYDSFILIVTYGVAISVSGLLATLGILALIRNGVASDASFSTILRTTRNKELDKKFQYKYSVGSPLPELKLKYGTARDWDGNGDHEAMVTIEEKKGDY